jgi:hypothetical protein
LKNSSALCRSATSAYTLLGTAAETVTSGGVGDGTIAGMAATSALALATAMPVVTNGRTPMIRSLLWDQVDVDTPNVRLNREIT